MTRLKLIFLLLIVVNCGKYVVESQDIITLPEDSSYEVTQDPLALKNLFKTMLPEESSIQSLIIGNYAIQTLMEKAQKRYGTLEMRLLQWTDHVSNLALIEKQLSQYVQHHDRLESDTLINYAEWCVSLDSGAIKSILEKIHNIVAPMFKNQGLIEMVQKFYTKDDMCELTMSGHQLVLEVYNVLVKTEAKSYAIMQICWKLLKMYGRGDFEQEAKLMRDRYLERATKMAEVARSVLLKADRDFHRCEPDEFDSSNYAEITRLLQGYIENEADLNSDNTCKKNCAFYQNAAHYNCYANMFCAKQRTCEGKIYSCRFIESDMWVCPANYYSSRRYEYIEYESGKVLGHKTYCSLGHTQVESWWRWFVHCSYCMCLCDDPSYNSHRYFSLRPVVSDIEQNKVVTGAQIVKLGKVFYLKIYQSTLLKDGLVGPAEEVEVEKVDPSEWSQSGQYFQLSYDERGVELDTVEAPRGNVLTGLRFQKSGGNLRLEIRYTAFNYTTGQLYPQSSAWHHASTSYRSSVTLHAPDMPVRMSGHSTMSSDGDYVQFTNSDFDKDAAQSTVPFIDVQPVLSNVAAATTTLLNNGAGLYHRGTYGSGGFIGLRLRTLDYSDLIQADIPEEIVHEVSDIFIQPQ